MTEIISFVDGNGYNVLIDTDIMKCNEDFNMHMYANSNTPFTPSIATNEISRMIEQVQEFH